MEKRKYIKAFILLLFATIIFTQEYDLPADQKAEQNVASAAGQIEIFEDILYIPRPATDPQPATEPFPATELHQFHLRDATTDTMENSYVLIADGGFLKIEFLYVPGDPIVPINAFLISINGTTNSSSQSYVSTDITTFVNGSSSTLYGSFVWTNLTADNYTIDISVQYNDNSTSDILLTYLLNTNIRQPCSQETFATFFSLEIYSITPLLQYYPFCGYNFSLFVDIVVDEGRVGVFQEPDLQFAVIAFRGAQTAADIAIDEEGLTPISCSTVYDFDCAGNVGLGYANSYNQIKTSKDSNGMTFLDLLGNLTDTNFVLMTGHSKGGAEATLAIIDVITLELFFEVHISTFGIPAYADEDFAAFWDDTVNFDNGTNSIWYYHQDTLGHRDIVVATTMGAGGIPLKIRSLYFDRNCTSDLDCHQLLMYPTSQISKRATVNVVTTPNSGYYYVGSDLNFYGFQTNFLLPSFAEVPIPSTTPTASKSRTPSMFSSHSISLSRSHSRSSSPSLLSSRSPTISVTPSQTRSHTRTISKTSSRSPSRSFGSSSSPSRTPTRSFTSTASINSSPSPTRSVSPTISTARPSRSPSISHSVTPSFTPNFTFSSSPTPFLTSTSTATRTPITISRSRSRSHTPSRTQTSNRRSRSSSHTPSESPSRSHSHSRSRTPSHTRSHSHSHSRTRTRSPQHSFAFPLSFNFCVFFALFIIFAI